MVDPAPDEAPGVPLDPDRFRGINVAGQLRLVGMHFDPETGLNVGDVQVRVDVWPMWIEIAAAQRNLARETRAQNPGVDDSGFGESLRVEMKHSMMSVAAAAFALEAFAASIKHHRPEVAEQVNADSTDGRIHQVFTRAAKFTNETSKNSRDAFRQLFRVRDRAVHPPADWAEPVTHPAFPVGVHPMFVTYRLENAETASVIAATYVRHVAANPRGNDPDWLAWCAAVVTEMEALVLKRRH